MHETQPNPANLCLLDAPPHFIPKLLRLVRPNFASKPLEFGVFRAFSRAELVRCRVVEKGWAEGKSVGGATKASSEAAFAGANEANSKASRATFTAKSEETREEEEGDAGRIRHQQKALINNTLYLSATLE